MAANFLLLRVSGTFIFDLSFGHIGGQSSIQELLLTVVEKLDFAGLLGSSDLPLEDALRNSQVLNFNFTVLGVWLLLLFLFTLVRCDVTLLQTRAARIPQDLNDDLFGVLFAWSRPNLDPFLFFFFFFFGEPLALYLLLLLIRVIC